MLNAKAFLSLKFQTWNALTLYIKANKTKYVGNKGLKLFDEVNSCIREKRMQTEAIMAAQKCKKSFIDMVYERLCAVLYLWDRNETKGVLCEECLLNHFPIDKFSPFYLLLWRKKMQIAKVTPDSLWPKYEPMSQFCSFCQDNIENGHLREIFNDDVNDDIADNTKIAHKYYGKIIKANGLHTPSFCPQRWAWYLRVNKWVANTEWRNTGISNEITFLTHHLPPCFLNCIFTDGLYFPSMYNMQLTPLSLSFISVRSESSKNE